MGEGEPLKTKQSESTVLEGEITIMGNATGWLEFHKGIPCFLNSNEFRVFFKVTLGSTENVPWRCLEALSSQSNF